ncbi:DUF2157 domain-containing protein [Nocardioides sp. HDW12B]|uniref:DUF2157 domain-containing protein n=1 Tax=Nocardioides sp. HDW12B TaxID=2714939 RepID=UPI001408971E|nr:DUF2157 domain-containing protein [Nocardioides sp. HDW12B]QIK66295.1 DUF2157 domain-containing protein [Nocardioides sp. HDW12B]
MSTSSPVRATQPPLPEQHPTHPVTPGHLTWLSSQVVEWQREGLIAPWQAQALVTRYHATRTLGLARLLLALGAVFVGFGLIWLVAANLDRFTPLTRFGVVATIWVAVTVGAELLAARRAHGGPVPSPVVHAGRLLAALLFGAVVFQAAQSLQVPAYEPRLVGVWALGALLHGYLVRAAAPVVLGVTAGFTWLVWSAALDEPTVLGILLVICAAGVGAVAVATLHDRSGPRPAGAPDLASPWRVAGVVVLLGALFAAALPFVEGHAAVWTPRLVTTVVVATLLALAAVVVTLRSPVEPVETRRRLAWEPLAALGVTGLAVVLVLWDAGADASDVGLVDWAHAAVAVLGYLAVSAGVAALGVLRDRTELTVIALVALVLFTTVQSFAVFAQIIDGAWLFLLMGLILAGSGWLADRGRRQLAKTLGDDSPGAVRPTASDSTVRPEQGDLR